LSFSVQTNGVLLDEAWCETLGTLDIRIGISLDILSQTHNKYRVDHKGKGSYSKTIAGLVRAQSHPDVQYHPGVLMVIDVEADPDQFIQQILALQLRSVNLLFPDRTYSDLLANDEQITGTPYGDWLIRVFDLWFSLPVSNRPAIRLFQQIINLILGFETPTNVLGRSNGTFLVVETDGSVEPEDSLKVCNLPGPKEKLHLQTHSFEAVLTAPLIALFASSHLILPTGCRSCPIQKVCGGGFMVHRYHPTSGFDNPSSYCLDLLKTITHIQSALLTWLPSHLTRSMGVQPLTYENALAMLGSGSERVRRQISRVGNGLGLINFRGANRKVNFSLTKWQGFVKAPKANADDWKTNYNFSKTMANKSLLSIVNQLRDTDSEFKDDLSELTPEEAEELAGGATDVNVACAENRGCPISNTSCGAAAN
jgi:uncharacterized protein